LHDNHFEGTNEKGKKNGISVKRPESGGKGNRRTGCKMAHGEGIGRRFVIGLHVEDETKEQVRTELKRKE